VDGSNCRYVSTTSYDSTRVIVVVLGPPVCDGSPKHHPTPASFPVWGIILLVCILVALAISMIVAAILIVRKRKKLKGSLKMMHRS
jgi:hypothetical protein